MSDEPEDQEEIVEHEEWSGLDYLLVWIGFGLATGVIALCVGGCEYLCALADHVK